MGEQETDSFSSPYLVFIHGNEDDDNYFVTFSPITKDGDHFEKVVQLDLRNEETEIELGCDNWLIVWTGDKSDDQIRIRFSLWNILTMEPAIDFPELKLEPDQEIEAWFLTAPPGNPDCMLLLFQKKRGPKFIYCREGGDGWTEQLVSDKIFAAKSTFVMCNGKLYCDCNGEEIAEIDIKPEVLDVSYLDFPHKSRGKHPWRTLRRYRVESCGEVFEINFYHRGFSDKYYTEVCCVEIYKADFSRKEWHGVDSFEDRAFFVGTDSNFSCLANGSTIKGNHIYFTLEDDDATLYIFSMEDKTISYLMPLQSFPEEWFPYFWLMLDPKSTDPLQGKEKEEIKFITNFELHSGEKGDEFNLNEGNRDFDNLPIEMIFEIGGHLELRDYLNFRAVNTIFKSAAPLNRWTRLEGNFSSPPLLMTSEISKGAWNFIDPIHKSKYFITHNHELKDARMCYSKGGWCVIVYEDDSILLWNPFAKKNITLPTLRPELNVDIAGCSFSSSPDSLKSDCTVVLLTNLLPQYCISVIKLGDMAWRNHYFKPSIGSDYTVAYDNYPIFYKGSFYFLDEDGNLGVYKEDEDVDYDVGEDFEVLSHVIHCPCKEFQQKFLLECDGKLLSIFVGLLGKKVEIFSLDESKMDWVGVEDLGNYTIYLSYFSSFSTTASPKMHNRIYFPKYYGERSMVYYSLQSRRLHSHDTEEVLEDFYNTTEQISTGWIIPTLYTQSFFSL